MADLEILGKGPAYPFERDSGGVWPLAEKEALVVMGMKQAVMIGRGERPMWKEKGCELKRILFLPDDPNRAALIKKFITEAINQVEPRAIVVDVISNDAVDEPDVVRVEIQYSVIESNVVNNLVIPFNKGEAV